MKFETEKTLFSPSYIDKGTLAMLSVVELTSLDKVLDLGCGYGVVGIFAAKMIGPQNIVMSDVNKKSTEITQRNIKINAVTGVRVIKSDGFKQMDESNYTWILSNPPYHTDFHIARHFIEKGFNRLQMNGKMVMVTKRKEWYKNKLISIFGGVNIFEIDGYYVFVSEKRDFKYANARN